LVLFFYAPILLSPNELESLLTQGIGARPVYSFSLWCVYKIWNGEPKYSTIIMSSLVG
jgi:hypothetical protein